MDENTKNKTIDTIVEKLQPTILEAITPATIDGVYEKMKAEMPHRKNIFSDGSLSERQELEDKKKQAADFVKAMGKRDYNTVKTLSSGTAGSGLDMVPTYVSDQLITVQQKYGLVRKYGRKFPLIKGINENIPTATTVTAYRLGSDTSSIQASQPTTGAVSLRAKTVGVIVPVSKVLLENSTIDLLDAITFLAGKAIAKLEDQWGILGLGTGEGVFQTSGVPAYTLSSGNTLYKNATAEDLLSTTEQVDENFIGDSMRWIMSFSVLNNFRRLRANVSTDKQGFLFEAFGGERPSTMWDIPYDTTAIMPKNTDGSQAGKAFMALVDYENLIYGDAMEYTMEMSDSATIVDTDNSTLQNMFQQNMVALKIWGLVDIQLSNPTKAFALLKTAAS